MNQKLLKFLRRDMLHGVALVAFVCGCSISLFAQGKISGTVTDENGVPMVGATVAVKGTNVGIMTGNDGKFMLSAAPESVLTFSYIGFVTQEIQTGSRTVINVVMKAEANSFDEVIVVAYGTAKKSTFTGSSSVVKSDNLEKISATGFAEAMQGLSTGVNVVNPQGNPGGNTRVEIRGMSSMSGISTPLYVVDGMPFDGNLNHINPSDIESLTILKDAAATSLYGSRAANGVVMISTKHGKRGKPKVNFRSAWGTSDNAVPNPTKANPYEQLENTWYALYYDALYFDGMSKQDAGNFASDNALTRQVKGTEDSNGNLIFVTPFKYLPGENYVLHDGNGNPFKNPKLEQIWDEKDYNVYKALFSHKIRQEYSVDVSGQSENGKTVYYFSGGYLDDNGYNSNQYYKRYSFRSNVDAEIYSWWKAGGSLAYSYSRQNMSGGNSRALNFFTSLASPWLRNVDNTGWVLSEKSGQRMYDYGKYTNNFFGIHVFNNAGDYWNNPNDDSFSNNMGHLITSQFHSDFLLPFGLKFRTAISIDDIWQRDMSYGSAVHGSGQTAPYGVSILADGGDASRKNYNRRSTTWNNVLSGEWKISGDHTITALAGHEWYAWSSVSDEGYGSGIMELGKYELANTTKNFTVSSDPKDYALLSFFGKADYNFRNRYYISASVREDGSSRFHANKRWGVFGSVGASWRISSEPFMENLKWLDNLSIRATYGTTGNDKLVSRSVRNPKEVLYGYQGTYTSDDLYLKAGLKPATYPAPDLRWEANAQTNIGLDFALFNRISGSVEYYSRTSRDLLYYKELPPSAQVGEATGYNMNIGDLRNSGVEFTLNANIFRTKDFVWDIDGNLSTLKNEVLHLPSGAFVWLGTACTYKMEEGKSIFEFIAPQFDGVNPQTGMPGWKIRDNSGNWVRTEDRSKITTDDYVYVGSAIPKLFGSITNSFRYKGFDLSFMFYFSYGSKFSDYSYKERVTNRAGVGMVQSLVQDRWRNPGDENVTFPRWSYTQYAATAQYATNFVFDNHYWRLRNLTLGYTLPSKLTKKAFIENLRIYVSGNNLLTFGPAAKRFSDPETGIMGNSYNGNDDTDNGIQGSRRVYMGGIQITF
ncbi:MAG: TonB-dependent receptor [Prevotellaceae bacterium]|jgi:TonB-linked SusC/RagA family outer membrane protein|nr:TonB-dependent receptor [Prevotellaceae bacterium]